MNLLGIDYDNVKFKLATKFWMSFGRCYSIELDRETMFMGVRDITIISKPGKKALQKSFFFFFFLILKLKRKLLSSFED